jgi:ABC-type Na+ efflux pump permease subunit
MTLLPVMMRELQGEARRSFNYWLRVLGAGAVVVAFCATILDLSSNRVPSVRHGIYLFMALNSALSLAIWVLVPLLTADCISREKREGTLGLLLLTPLSGRDIVVAKVLIQSLRAATLILAALPMLALPLILGGVGVQWAVYSMLSQVQALLLALAAGLIASVRNTEWTRTVIAAELLSAAFALLFGGWLLRLVPAIFRFVPVSAIGLCNVFIAAVVLGIVVHRCGRRLKDHWQTELTAPPQPKWVGLFADSEFWRQVFRWNKSRTLDRNPIAWLQEYSWTARLTKWGWCIVILFCQVGVLLVDRGFVRLESRLNLLLALGLAFSASGSFRRDRETGALELLLVTPLQGRQLMGGRLWGIWGYFLPAMAIVYSCWLFVPYDRTGFSWSRMLFGLSSYFSIPIIGLYFSLWRMNFLVSWLVTCAAGLLLPSATLTVCRRFAVSSRTALFVSCGLQLLLAAFAAHQLYRDLNRRTFASATAASSA